MSVKSDCGLGGGRQVVARWSSESHLEHREPPGGGRLQAGGHKPFKALSLNTLLKVSYFSSTKQQNIKKISSAGPGPGWAGHLGEGEDEGRRGQHDGKHQGSQ